MTGVIVVQGRELSGEDIGQIQAMLSEHPDWGRTRISEELCRCWDWRNALGRPKDMAARTLLLKLERSGHIQLPPRQRPSSNGFRNRNVLSTLAPSVPMVAPAAEPIHGILRDLQPLSVCIVTSASADMGLFNGLLAGHHYLGHRNTVGENLRYLVRDRIGRPVACALFGSAAWKCADRDAYVGWDRVTRERNLQRLTNNTRFLILPWVAVPHLASHVLGLLARRIRADWQAKYGHPVYALETFVDRSRFRGVCYQAANWLRLGATQGRTRNDRNHTICTAVKDVYLLAQELKAHYPLAADFRQRLLA
jgi:hypothetical protein